MPRSSEALFIINDGAAPPSPEDGVQLKYKLSEGRRRQADSCANSSAVFVLVSAISSMPPSLISCLSSSERTPTGEGDAGIFVLSQEMTMRCFMFLVY